MDDIKKYIAVAVVVSATALGFIAKNEGFVDHTYQDATPQKVLTIGYGHTGSDVKAGQKITKQQATVLLQKDAQKHWDGIKTHIKVKVTQGEADAYTSFTYNAGVRTFLNSSMLKYLNMGQHLTACSKLKLYKCGGFKTVCKNGKCTKQCNALKGLIKRREGEYQICIRDLTPANNKLDKAA